MSRFSATVRLSSRWYCWKTNPTCFLLSSMRSFGFRRWTSCSRKPVLARPVVVEHAEDREQRRLARARRPHDRHELALRDRRGRCGGARRSRRRGWRRTSRRSRADHRVHSPFNTSFGSIRAARRAGRPLSGKRNSRRRAVRSSLRPQRDRRAHAHGASRGPGAGGEDDDVRSAATPPKVTGSEGPTPKRRLARKRVRPGRPRRRGHVRPRRGAGHGGGRAAGRPRARLRARSGSPISRRPRSTP